MQEQELTEAVHQLILESAPQRRDELENLWDSAQGRDWTLLPPLSLGQEMSLRQVVIGAFIGLVSGVVGVLLVFAVIYVDMPRAQTSGSSQQLLILPERP
jgi:hypothetical protein